jgi:hypothetical protein
MAGGCHAAQRQVGRPDQVQFALRLEVEGDGQVHGSLGQAAHGLVGADDVHFQNDAGVLLRHTVDEARQKAVHVAVHGRKPELALAHALQLLDVGQRAVEVGLPALRQRQQQLPGCREPHAARQPLEQRHAHVFLQHEDLAVDGRGRDRHLAGGRLHRPELGHSRQIAQGLGMQGGVQGGHALPETGWNMLNYAMDSNATGGQTAEHAARHDHRT